MHGVRSSIPAEYYQAQPLSPGWTHSQHSYLYYDNGWTVGNTMQLPSWHIFLPGAITPISFYKKNGTFICYNEGVYDKLTEVNGEFRLEALDKTLYIFRRVGTTLPIYNLETITDREGRVMRYEYYPMVAGATTRLLQYVYPPLEPTGSPRRLAFVYHNQSNRIYIVKYPDPTNTTSSRELVFGYIAVAMKI